MDERLAACGIDPDQYWILLLLEKRTPSQQRIADILYLRNKNDRNKMTREIDKLENKGLAIRRVNPDNRREKLIEISEQGHATLTRARLALNDVETDFSRDFRLVEFHRFGAMLRKVKPYPKRAGVISIAKERRSESA